MVKKKSLDARAGADLLAALEAQIAARRREADRLGASAGFPAGTLPQLNGLDRAQEQVTSARRELVRGNLWGLEYHLAAAEEALIVYGINMAVPRSLPKIVRTARGKANSERALAQAVSDKVDNASKSKAKARAAMVERLRQGRSYNVIKRELVKEFKRDPRTIRNWTSDLKPQKRK